MTYYLSYIQNHINNMSTPYIHHDKYFAKAQARGLRARSVFKLEEIQQKFHLFKPSLDVLDLGAAPGSWLQYVAMMSPPPSILVGVDLLPIDWIAPHVKTIVGDIFSIDIELKIRTVHPDNFPIIISDLAPKTSGMKEVDHLRSLDLSRRVLDLARQLIAPSGTLVLKVFQGSDFSEFTKDVKKLFSQVSLFKPKSSRVSSREIYLIAIGFLR